MPADDDVRPLSLDTIPDAIALMNESSRGMTTEYHFDFFSFLIFQGYWNVTSRHSLIRYVDGTPAAIVLTCTDESAREAYTLYWGASAKFRTLRIARALFETCCQRLFEDGYQMLYGLSVPDRPVTRYRFVHAVAQFQLFDLETDGPVLPASNADILVQPIDLKSLSSLSIPPGDCIEWSQRVSFLRRVASTLKCFGVFAGDVMKAYAVIRSDPSGLATLIDLRSSEGDLCWGQELLRQALVPNYPPPFAAINVADQSYSYRLLTAAGFQVKRRFHLLSRDLRTTVSSFPAPSS